jgi:hypothetical protein
MDHDERTAWATEGINELYFEDSRLNPSPGSLTLATLSPKGARAAVTQQRGPTV